MRVEVTMPQMGESITEGRIIRWAKQPGATVARDETLLEISTDKVDSEIPSPQAGVLVEILHPVEATVPVGTAIAVIETDAAAAGGAPGVPPPAGRASLPASRAPEEPAPTLRFAPGEVRAPTGEPRRPPEAPGALPARTDGRRFFSPLVRRLAAEHGVSADELSAIPGSGANERVTKADFLAWLEQRSAAADREPVAAGESLYPPPPPVGARPPPPRGEGGVEVRGEGASRGPQHSALSTQHSVAAARVERVPMDRMRQAIAQHMVQSVHTSPHVYTLTEADMHRVVEFRERFRRRFEEQEGFRLTYTAFIADAAVRALRDFPAVNVSVDGTDILYKKDVNLGLAVALGAGGTGGLIVPNVKRADTLNFVGLARALQDLSQRARAGKLLPDDVAGGTFTITNMGMFGSTIGLPIINQPQAAILGVGAIKDRPVAIDKMLAVRPVMFLSLSYDHRVVDGALGAQFLERVRAYLEGFDPAQTGLEGRRAGDPSA